MRTEAKEVLISQTCNIDDMPMQQGVNKVSCQVTVIVVVIDIDVSSTVMMSDGEAPILAWKTHAAAGLARLLTVEFVSSCCGRCAGRRNTRRLTKQFGELHKVEPKVNHLIHLWQVEFLRQRPSTVGAGGQMARLRGSLRHGRPFKRDLVNFSEKILHLCGVNVRAHCVDQFDVGTERGALVREKFQEAVDHANGWTLRSQKISYDSALFSTPPRFHDSFDNWHKGCWTTSR